MFLRRRVLFFISSAAVSTAAVHLNILHVIAQDADFFIKRGIEKANNGDIKSMFHTKEKYIQFIKESNYLGYDIIGEFLGPMIFSEKGAKIFVEQFLKLQKTHQGSFHKAPSLKKAYLTDMLQELIDSKINIEPVFVEGKWCEIDTMQDLKIAEELFSD